MFIQQSVIFSMKEFGIELSGARLFISRYENNPYICSQMKKAGIIAFIVIIQFYLLAYRALYIYCASNHVSLSSVNKDSQDNQNIVKFSNQAGTAIGKNIPPKHNDRFANLLTALPVTHSY